MNKLTEFIDVQSGHVYQNLQQLGRDQGGYRVSASGTFARKRGRQLCDSASAAMLRLPGMKSGNILKSKCAAMKILASALLFHIYSIQH